MSNINFITVEINCKKCNYRNEFTDELKNCGMRPDKCQDFEMKFIKNTDNDYYEYYVTFNCKNCKNSGSVNFNYSKINNNDIFSNIDIPCMESMIFY